MGGGDDTVNLDGTVSNVSVTIDNATHIGTLNMRNGYSGNVLVTYGIELTVGQTGGSSTFSSGKIFISSKGKLKLDHGAFGWEGGTIADSLIGVPGDPPPFVEVSAGTSVSLNGEAVKHLQIDLANSGNFTVSGDGNIELTNGVDISNNTDAVFDIRSDADIVELAGQNAGNFTNKGNVTKSMGGGTTSIAIPFSNDVVGAELQIQSGTLYFQDTAKQTLGKTSILENATLQVFDTYEVNGGTLESTGVGGRILGNLKLTGGDFYVGGDGNLGGFTVTNNYTQTGGKLHIDVDGEDSEISDILDVGNTATLGGNLTVNTLGGHVPGSDFEIITYAARTGDFATPSYIGATYTTDPDDENGFYWLIPPGA